MARLYLYPGIWTVQLHCGDLLVFDVSVPMVTCPCEMFVVRNPSCLSVWPSQLYNTAHMTTAEDCGVFCLSEECRVHQTSNDRRSESCHFISSFLNGRCVSHCHACEMTYWCVAFMSLWPCVNLKTGVYLNQNENRLDQGWEIAVLLELFFRKYTN